MAYAVTAISLALIITGCLIERGLYKIGLGLACLADAIGGIEFDEISEE